MSEKLKKYCDGYGKQKQLADACEVSPQAVTKWLKNGVTAERAVQIEMATGGEVSRHDLRPDLYPVDNEAAA